MTDPVPVGSPSGNVDIEDGTVRSYSECGGPLADNRQYTCGPECAQARNVRMKHAPNRPRRDPLPPGDVPVLAGAPAATGNGSSPIPVADAREGLTAGGLQLCSAGQSVITPPPIIEKALELVGLASESAADVALELRAGGVRLTIG